MKATLQLDPGLDVVANRLPNVFIHHAKTGGRLFTEQIERLAGGLDDAGALVMSLAVIRLMRRPSGGNLTFGLRRSEILSAQANGGTLLVLAGLIVYAGIHRLGPPPGPAPPPAPTGGGPGRAQRTRGNLVRP